MRSLNVSDLVAQLHDGLTTSFYDEEFLMAELEGVIQALVNSVGWAALVISKSKDWEPVYTMETDDHFANEFMNRDQIVSRIENTSGLNSEMSSRALEIIESLLDNGLNESSIVDVEHIGVIEMSALPRYTIHLSDELRVAPALRSNDRRNEGIPSTVLES